MMTLFQLGASVVFHKPLQRGPFHMQRSTDTVQKERGREGGREGEKIIKKTKQKENKRSMPGRDGGERASETKSTAVRRS